MKKSHYLRFIILLFIYSIRSEACPDYVLKFKSRFLPTHIGSLCQLYDRYHKAIDRLESVGLKPATRVADVMAPRLINMPDWYRVKNNDPQFSAWTVYDPSPQTWASWQKVSSQIDSLANVNLMKERVPPLSLEWVKQIHNGAVDGLDRTSTDLRSMIEYGLSLREADAISLDQVGALKAITTAFPLSENSYIFHYGRCRSELSKNDHARWFDRPIQVVWHQTQCIEQLPAAIQNKMEAIDDLNSSVLPDMPSVFTDKKGTKRACGYIVYPSPNSMRHFLDEWLTGINSEIQTWPSAHPSSDPILLASRAQRYFIQIHPFPNGNGRTSRFIMEYLLESLGLPTPTIENMNDDIYSTENAWAKELGNGMLRTVETLETCAYASKSPGCQIITTQPPPDALDS